MSAVTQQETKALTLPERAAVALGESANAAKLRELAAQSAGIVIINSADGREEAHRAAMVLRSMRTSITNTGKAAREDATAFSKAVIALEKDLIAIIEPEETRVLKLRDEWDEKIAAEKAAKIAAERARVEVIQGRIEAIRRAPLAVVGESSAAILVTLELVRDTIIDDSFDGLKDQAMAARSEAFNALEAAHAKATESEAAALAAEQSRRAEVARIEAERAELAQLRAAAAETARLAKIETDRIAAEQAAEAKRLRDLAAAQELAASKLREAAEANLQAEREAMEERMRIERQIAVDAQADRDRVAAETKRQLDAQQAEIAAQRAAFVREQEEVRARAEAAAQLERDHAEALPMNAQFEVDREAERVRLQACADQAAADHREQAEAERACSMPAGSLAPVEIAEVLDDDQLIKVIKVTFDFATMYEAVERLEQINFAAARLRHEVAP